MTISSPAGQPKGLAHCVGHNGSIGRKVVLSARTAKAAAGLPYLTFAVFDPGSGMLFPEKG